MSQVLHNLELYLPLLENLILHVDRVKSHRQIVRWTSELKIQWTSALSSSFFFNLIGSKYFQINNLRFELCMTLFLYGAIIRERALEVLPADLVQSATLFREAAGVFHHLAHQVIPFLQHSLIGERPPEVVSSVSAVMSLICLGDAQAVTIKRAKEKGTTVGLLAKLHHGIVELLDEAAGVLHTARECKDTSLDVADFISSCKMLHELQAQKYFAETLKSSNQFGVAVAVLRFTLTNVKKNMPGKESWKSVIKEEIDNFSELLRKHEHENEFVWHEKVPSEETLSGRVVSAVVSAENTVQSGFSGTDGFKLTYLELSDIPEVDCLLITQSLDDHCHLKTLKPLSKKYPNLRVIATPNAKALLDSLFSNVTYLEPGQSSIIEAGNGSTVKVQATAGPVLGPPWQRPENGYLVIYPEGKSTLYYEPHCVYNTSSLEKERADIIITPVIKQLLPKFTLVSGQEDAVRLAKLLNAKFIVPMTNGDLDAKGLLASLVSAEGTIESFKDLLSKELPDAQVLQPTPGVPLEIPLPPNLP
ncbi:BRO1 domain-containing protein BROX [Pyrus ussuriensis x Pyrus communis]|uniref:BRO1 domain-containing protein BROX n=1 Tax=Pyrus ussuriensis x Pyrus communis TaxID=2448454 RepID=A0A5N5HBM0_9ROSA|nr:BRO1 domain-containing protein BROX [Pyrus ussuriensis x Pyrus communis]